MTFSDNKRETLGWVIRLHWFLVAGLVVVFFVTEGWDSTPGISAYDIVFSAALVLLGIWFLYLTRHAEKFLAPLLFLLDGAAISAGVALSGGPVSFYLPLYFISILGVCLVCSPKVTWMVILEHFILFGVAMAFAHNPWRPDWVPAPGVDDMSYWLEWMPPVMRDRLYLEQCIRWGFITVFFIFMAVSLMRRMWVREEQLRIRERALEQKRRLIQMGEMTGRIAHGVNSPLGLLSGNLEMMLAETRKGTKVHKRLMELDGFVQRAITTVRQTLDYSRQSMSQIRSVSIPSLLGMVAETVQPKLKKRRVDLILNLEKDVPNVTGYQEGLFQAFLNVVENAVDALPEGAEGVVTVTASFHYRKVRLSAGDRRGDVVVEVRDTGRGIPPGELDRVFEPFYSTKDFGHGTGLGLSIVKRIVEEHQGTLEIESRVGVGTSVTLAFPAEQSTLERKPAEPSSEGQGPS